MKTRLLLFLILLLPNFLFAAQWADEFPIRIYGDVSYIATIYEFVNSIITSDTAFQLFYLGITITVMFAFYKAKDGDVTNLSLSLAAPMALVGMFFMPTSTVHIVDIRVDKGFINHTASPDGGYQKVEGVPYAIAMLPASIFTLVNLTVDLIDDNWASVHIGNKFSATGFQTTSFDVQKQAVAKSCESKDDADVSKYEYNIRTYINKCITGRALLQSKNHKYVAAPDKAFPLNLMPSNFPSDFGDDLVDYYHYDNTSSTSATCDQAYVDLVSTDASKYISSCKESIDSGHPTRDITSLSASEAFRQQIGDTGNTIGSIQKMKATTVVSRMVEKDRYMDAIDLATDTAISSTLADMRTEGPAKLAWMAKVLPDSILIIMGLFIASFPLLIIVQSYMGFGAYMAIANYFMGMFALYFNFVGLALVQNVISFYTAQQAQNYIVSQAGMPFSARYMEEFLLQQADMTGLAGMIGAASIVALTPLIFKGESRGFATAMGAATGAFRGGVDKTAQDNITRGALEAQIDKELLEERQGMSDAQASKWLQEGGFQKNANMSALETYSQIQKGSQMIGAGRAAADLVKNNNNSLDDYIKGSQLTSTQQNMKTAGMGNSIDSISDAGEVSFQDGQVMAENINATGTLRMDGGYDTKDIGTGQAMMQYAQDMGTANTGKNISDVNALVANAVNQSESSIAAGKGLIKSEAFGKDGQILENEEAKRYLQGVENQSRTGINKTIGAGAIGDLSNDQMSSIQASSLEATKAEIQAGKTLRDNLGGRDLDGSANVNGKSITLDQMLANEADNKLAGRVGSAVGYSELDDKTKGKAFDMIAQNASYGVQSQNLTTDAKIKEQGGVDSAVNVDTTESGMKANTQMKTLDETLKEGGAKDGLDSSIKDLAKAIDKLSDKDATMASGKTASDLATLDAHDGNYVENLKGKAFKSARVDALQSEMYDEKNKDKLQQTYEDMKKRVFDTNKGTSDQKLAAQEKFVQDAKEKGIIDKNGKVTTGDTSRRAWAEMEAGAAAADSRFMLGDNRFNVSRDMSTGKALVNVDGSTSNKQGDSKSLNNTDTVDQGKNMYSIKDVSSRAQNYLTETFGMSDNSADLLATGAAGVAGAVILNKTSKSMPGMKGESFYQKSSDRVKSYVDNLRGKTSVDPVDSTQYNNQNKSADDHSKHSNSFKNYGNNPTHAEYKDSIAKNAGGFNSLKSKLASTFAGSGYMGAAIDFASNIASAPTALFTPTAMGNSSLNNSTVPYNQSVAYQNSQSSGLNFQMSSIDTANNSLMHAESTNEAVKDSARASEEQTEEFRILTDYLRATSEITTRINK